MPWPKKVHTREMLTKNSLDLKIPHGDPSSITFPSEQWVSGYRLVVAMDGHN